MLDLNLSAAFKKDRRRCIKRGCNMAMLAAVVNTLRIPAALPPERKDHTLTGNWAGFQECHIQPDWLLVYRVEGNSLYLVRTGTHADLFE